MFPTIRIHKEKLALLAKISDDQIANREINQTSHECVVRIPRCATLFDPDSICFLYSNAIRPSIYGARHAGTSTIYRKGFRLKNQISPRPWTKLGSEAGPTLPLGMQVRYDQLRNPRNGAERKALVIETGDWVNIVAVTLDERIVVVRQYRFGSACLSTEIPGGLVDPGEDHAVAAARELYEETGYTSDHWHYLGAVDPNPAFLTNRCHQWLARQAQPGALPTPEEGEDIVVATLTPAELGAEIQAGTFRHSLALLALAHVYDLRQLIGTQP